MPPKIRELRANLKKAGFSRRSGKGSHTIWKHPLVPYEVTISGNDGDDAKPYQEKDVRRILKDLREAERRQQ